MTTTRQAEANRRNARKSTGPKTAEGKQAARANALRHGLSGSGVVVTEAMNRRIAEILQSWRPSYAPASAEQEWMFTQIVTETVRVEFCFAEINMHRQYEAERAARAWDEDQEVAAERLGEKLARRPELYARQLRCSRAGILWLIERWEYLEAILDGGDAWTDDQFERACDLLGIARDARGPASYRVGGLRDDPKGTASGEIRALEARLEETFDFLDGFDQEKASLGMPQEYSQNLRRLIQYEAACHRRLLWARRAFATLKRQQQPPATTPDGYLPLLPPPFPPDDAMDRVLSDFAPIPTDPMPPVEQPIAPAAPPPPPPAAQPEAKPAPPPPNAAAASPSSTAEDRPSATSTYETVRLFSTPPASPSPLAKQLMRLLNQS